MIGALFEQTNYVASKKLLDASMMRHEAIASNVANLETPGYKRLDLAASFSDELRQAMASGDVKEIAAIAPRLAVDLTALANSRDGNTVQLETELAELNKNNLEHSLEVQLISESLVRLRLAITGRPI